MKIIKLIILFCALTCIACKSNDEDGGKKYVTLDNGYITLKMGETGILMNGNDSIKMSITDVSDLRCPKSTCYLCYGSEAHVSLSIMDSQNKKAVFNLSVIGCVDELDNDTGYDIDTLGYKFRMVKLSPYPDTEVINKNDYSAKIKITKL